MSAAYSGGEVNVRWRHPEDNSAAAVTAPSARRCQPSHIALAAYVVILWLAAAVTVAGGLWSVADPRIMRLELYYVYSREKITTIPILMIVCGTLSIAAGVVAMAGVVKKDQKLLGVFICLSAFLLAAWCGIGGYCASVHDTLDSTITTRFDQASKYVNVAGEGDSYRTWMQAMSDYIPKCCAGVDLQLCARACRPFYRELVFSYLMPAVYGLNFGMALVFITGLIVTLLSCLRLAKRRQRSYYY